MTEARKVFLTVDPSLDACRSSRSCSLDLPPRFRPKPDRGAGSGSAGAVIAARAASMVLRVEAARPAAAAASMLERSRRGSTNSVSPPKSSSSASRTAASRFSAGAVEKPGDVASSASSTSAPPKPLKGWMIGSTPSGSAWRIGMSSASASAGSASVWTTGADGKGAAVATSGVTGSLDQASWSVKVSSGKAAARQSPSMDADWIGACMVAEAARSSTCRAGVHAGSLSSGLSRIGVGARASMLSRASASRRAVRSSLRRIRSASSPEARS